MRCSHSPLCSEVICACASASSADVTRLLPYPQLTYPPPHVGYDHNWALFGLGMDAANKTHMGAISNE